MFHPPTTAVNGFSGSVALTLTSISIVWMGWWLAPEAFLQGERPLQRAARRGKRCCENWRGA
jgi:hypothetical protein